MFFLLLQTLKLRSENKNKTKKNKVWYYCLLYKSKNSLTWHDPAAPPQSRSLASTMSDPRILKKVTARSLRVRQRMRTAKRPLPNFVLRNRMTGNAITLAVNASKNMTLSTTMFCLSL